MPQEECVKSHPRFLRILTVLFLGDIILELQGNVKYLSWAGVAEWQTQWSQKPPRATSYRFDSDLRHQILSVKSAFPNFLEGLISCLYPCNGQEMVK